MDRLTSMAIFVRAVEKGAFAKVAEEFDISSAMVGLHVKALEGRVGSQLLLRTTRRQTLTDVGRLYYARCKQILLDVEAADATGEELQAAPQGLLRISAPNSFGVHALTPALSEFLHAHPLVQVDLSLSDRVVDLSEEGFDVAIRVGRLADEELIAKPLTPYQMTIAASPSYLKKHGTPRRPSDLADHNCLGFSVARVQSEWRFLNPDIRVKVKGSLHASNGEALRVAALAGLGVILQPRVLLEEEVRRRRLTTLLPNLELPSRPMHVMYVKERRPTAKLRAFVDFLVRRFPPLLNDR